jgi:hypothetical protein
MMKNRTLLRISVLALVVGLALSAPAGAARADAETQTAQAGAVTIKAIWQGPGAGPMFTVVLDTHAVNLDAYDLTQLAVLRTDQDEDAAPIGWDAPAGGHHREGTLSFPATRTDGSPLITAETQVLELRIREVGGVPETTLQWVLLLARSDSAN